MRKSLTLEILKAEAATFAAAESFHHEKSLYGITDGKAVGTYLGHKFQQYLQKRYSYVGGSSAKGIDFPSLEVDIKVTSIRQPQSSCPYKSARQKIYGLGYHLIVFIYEKTDDAASQTGRLNILHTIFVDRSRTADYQTTSGLRNIIENKGNLDDIISFFGERMLPLDDIQAQALAEEVMATPPEIGYLPSQTRFNGGSSIAE